MFLLSRWRNVRFAPEGDGGAGGGAGDPPHGSKGDDGAVSVTKEWVNDTVSKAIGARFKDFEVKQAKAHSTFETKLTELVTGMEASLSEKLSGGAGGGGKDEKKPNSDDVENHPTVKAMHRRMKEFEDRDKLREVELTAQKIKVRDKELRSELTKHLAKHKIEGQRALHAIGHLVDASKSVSYAEEGDNLIYREGDEEFTIEAGLKRWAESEDGKLYLPPRNANGSGDGPRGTRGAPPSASNGATPPSRAEIGEAILNLNGKV